MLDIEIACIFNWEHYTHRVARRKALRIGTTRQHERFNLCFGLFGKLEALSVEELDAIVLGRIMRSRDDDAPFSMELTHEICNAWRGDNTRIKHIATHTHDARGKRITEHIARKTRILAHYDGLTQEFDRSLSQFEGDIAGKFSVRNPANTISSEKFSQKSTFLLLKGAW